MINTIYIYGMGGTSKKDQQIAIDAANKIKNIYLTNWRNNTGQYSAPYVTTSILEQLVTPLMNKLRDCEERENTLRKRLFNYLLQQLQERMFALLGGSRDKRRSSRTSKSRRRKTLKRK